MICQHHSGRQLCGDDRGEHKSGDPMAVYERRALSGIAGHYLNNLFVGLFPICDGRIFAVGTVAILIGMASCWAPFDVFLSGRAAFLGSFLTIWIHGTLEISAIVIAGAAGITMGRAMVFPEFSYTRLQSFRQSARRGIKIMMHRFPSFFMRAL